MDTFLIFLIFFNIHLKYLTVTLCCAEVFFRKVLNIPGFERYPFLFDSNGNDSF